MGVFRSEPFDNQLLRTISLGSEGGSVIGECLVATSQIRDGDFDSWHEGWSTLARSDETRAEAYGQAGAEPSAARAWLRASNYWRTAATFLTARQPERATCSEASQRTYSRFLALSGLQHRRLTIPFEGVSMHGWLIACPGEPRARRTLLALNGGDSTAEEQHLYLGAEAVARGWTFASVEGPAQSSVIVQHPNRPFFADYERAVASMLDHLIDQPEVDAKRVAVYGLSLGGYFALRSAAVDERLRAVVANPPYTNFGKAQRAGLPAALTRLPTPLMNAILPLLARTNPLVGFAWRVYQDILGVARPSELFDKLDGFSVEDRVGAIRCPVLGLVGENEGGEVLRQARSLFDKLPHHRESRLEIGTADQGADAHCMTNNLPRMQALTFDWLDEVVPGEAAMG